MKRSFCLAFALFVCTFTFAQQALSGEGHPLFHPKFMKIIRLPFD